jgi:penicillin-binding protein 1A
MTVRLAKAVGMHKITAAAERDGVADNLPNYLPIALGAGEVTPFRLTAAYAEFANGGKRIQPHLIELAEDHMGQVVWKADRRDCPRCTGPYDGEESPRIPPDGTQVMDAITAYQITLMLQGVTQVGTAADVARAFGTRPIAGKTGTTNDYRSAWFVGYTPDLVVGVFVGFDNDASLGDKETGAHAALPIWIDFMQEALKDRPPTDFAAPPGVKMVWTHGHREAFRPGTEPKPPAPKPAGPAAPAAAMAPVPYTQAFPKGAAPAGAPPPPKPNGAQGLY